MINEELKGYLEKQIFPKYEKNDLGHNLKHVKKVIERSLKFAKKVSGINMDMVYTIAAYHDIGYYIDFKNHSKVASEVLLNDQNLRSFFNDEEIKIMQEAVYDHSASLDYEPRSIYGKIIASADKCVDVNTALQSTCAYRIKYGNYKSVIDIIEDSRLRLINKFGKNGYATTKIYFKDPEYKKFLLSISSLTDNKNKFEKRFIKVNNLGSRIIKEQIDKYVPENEQEKKDKAFFIRFINEFDDVLTRKNPYGHISSSAFVVDESFSKALVVNHNIFGGFVQAGGHADGNYDLIKVAKKEVKEETGLNVKPVTKDIFSIQVLPIKGHVKKGKYVSAHVHFDVLYLMVVKDEDMKKMRIKKDENSNVKFIKLDETYGNKMVDWIRPINRKIVDKINRLKKDWLFD